jgi:hypothetical protein
MGGSRRGCNSIPAAAVSDRVAGAEGGDGALSPLVEQDVASLQSLCLSICLKCISTRAGALTNLPRCGKVVSTRVGCGRFDGKYSRVAPALAVTRGFDAASF